PLSRREGTEGEGLLLSSLPEGEEAGARGGPSALDLGGCPSSWCGEWVALAGEEAGLGPGVGLGGVAGGAAGWRRGSWARRRRRAGGARRRPLARGAAWWR